MNSASDRSIRNRLAYFAIAFALLSNGGVTANLMAEEYPTRPVRVIVPFVAGSPSDATARRVAQLLAVKIGQPIVIDNRPGASGAIGATLVAQAKPDGYTLLWCNQATHGAAPALRSDLTYDPMKDFSPIVRVATAPLIIAVNPSLPSRSVAELVGLAKGEPGKLRYASVGNASLTHIFGELLAHRSGMALVHVPYKGDAAAMNDVIGGHVEVFFSNPFLVLPQVKAGRLRALAITGPRRLVSAPDLPTLTEAGISGADLLSWGGLCAPSGTPRVAVEKLNPMTTASFLAPELRSDFERNGYQVVSNSPEEFAVFIANEITHLSQLVKSLGIRLEE